MSNTATNNNNENQNSVVINISPNYVEEYKPPVLLKVEESLDEKLKHFETSDEMKKLDKHFTINTLRIKVLSDRSSDPVFQEKIDQVRKLRLECLNEMDKQKDHYSYCKICVEKTSRITFLPVGYTTCLTCRLA